jgi:hypothetical protein
MVEASERSQKPRDRNLALGSGGLCPERVDIERF